VKFLLHKLGILTLNSYFVGNLITNAAFNSSSSVDNAIAVNVADRIAISTNPNTYFQSADGSGQWLAMYLHARYFILDIVLAINGKHWSYLVLHLLCVFI